MSRKRRHRQQRKLLQCANQTRIGIQAHSTPSPVGTSSKPSLILIPQENVAEVWPLAENFIAAGTKLGEFSANDLQKQAIAGHAQLWFAWSDHCEAAAATSLMLTPAGKVCVIASMGGKDRSRWLGLIDDIGQWARTEGAHTMRIYGRKGWARVLKDYRVTRFVLDKEL